MPARRRIRNLVYIAVPLNGGAERESLALGRAACRLALQREMEPIFPLWHYAGLLTEEERTKMLPRLCVKWLWRACRIWLCNPTPEEDMPKLDPVTYSLLAENEGILLARRRPFYDASRLPIDLVWHGEHGLIVESIPRKQTLSALRCNISNGMLRGLPAEAEDDFDDLDDFDEAGRMEAAG